MTTTQRATDLDIEIPEVPPIGDRPRTPEEAKAFLVRHLLVGRMPFPRQAHRDVYETIQALPALDGERVVIVGASFGGYWATKLAHSHRQYLRGAVSWGGGAHYMYQRAWVEKSRHSDTYLMELPETRARMLGASSFDDYAERIARLSLLDQGILDQPCAPMLLVNGKQDTQCPIEDLYVLLEHGNPKTARVFEGGHMAPGPRTMATIATWVGKRLA
jgi:esterase FrsA